MLMLPSADTDLRPTNTEGAPRAARKALTANGLFIGQSREREFFEALRELAEEANAARLDQHGFTLRQQGPQNYARALEHFTSNRVWPRHMSTGECSLQKWVRKPKQKRTWLLLNS